MNLVIDIGNTSIKSAVFDGNNIIKTEIFNLNSDHFLKSIQNYQGKIIISSVVDHPSLSLIKENRTIFFFSNSSKIPIQNNYASPQSLGLDRLANAVGANLLSSKKNTLVIDCGTCLKFDLVENGVYVGGSISPGLKMRLQSLHNFTSKLPLIDSEIFLELIGKNTKDSILSGCFRGMLAEIQKTIDDYISQYKELEIFLTGGDHPIFVNHLKNRIFADPFLTLKGLNEILNYQNN